MACAAVIDIGSNSIKALVAERKPDTSLNGLFAKTLDARISAGIDQQNPSLRPDGLSRGLAAVQELLRDVSSYQPAQTLLVATSAVRDARNGSEFTQLIEQQTGHPVRVLSGDEEANLIGQGLTADPALTHLQNFYVFDLGGGSLECLAFLNRKITQAVSLQLGCVRLTERCVADPTAAFTPEAERAVTTLTREVFSQGGFHFNLPPDAIAVGTGGTLTTARSILAARRGKTLEGVETIITVGQLRELLAYVGWFKLDERRRIPAMPAPRADVFPAALATIIAVAEIGGVQTFQHSLYNLRWGVASQALAQASAIGQA